MFLLPQKLQVHVPVHCSTVRTADLGTKPKGIDEKLTLAVSILDVSTGAPIKCVVALHGDNDIKPSKGLIICLLSLSVSVVGECRSPINSKFDRNVESTYALWRSKRSDYVANGQVTFYMCFYEADANYIVTLNIDTVLDEEGMECLGYKVEHSQGLCLLLGQLREMHSKLHHCGNMKALLLLPNSTS